MNREDFITVLNLQYRKALDLMEKVLSSYDETLWFDRENYGDAAWQIAYHALFYTNLYLAPTEDRLIPWPGQREGYASLRGGKDSDREDLNPDETYSREELLVFLNHIRANQKTLLNGFQPEEDCWPPWYDESQMEFHFNNLRHLQQHMGALIERHDRVKNLSIGWK